MFSWQHYKRRCTGSSEPVTWKGLYTSEYSMCKEGEAVKMIATLKSESLSY